MPETALLAPPRPSRRSDSVESPIPTDVSPPSSTRREVGSRPVGPPVGSHLPLHLRPTEVLGPTFFVRRPPVPRDDLPETLTVKLPKGVGTPRPESSGKWGMSTVRRRDKRNTVTIRETDPVSFTGRTEDGTSPLGTRLTYLTYTYDSPFTVFYDLTPDRRPVIGSHQTPPSSVPRPTVYSH